MRVRKRERERERERESESEEERERGREREEEEGGGRKRIAFIPTWGDKDNFTRPTLTTVTSEIGRVAGSGVDSAMMCVTSSLR